MKSLLIIGVLVFVSMVNGQTAAIQPDKEAAQRIWELAIQAKGGRDKLFNIRSMVISSEGKFYKGFKKINIHLEDLYVFPNKSWSWDDQRPSVFGLSMSMYNWETGKKYSVQFGGEPYKGLETIESNSKSTNFAGLIDYFLETKWNQPKPENTFLDKVGSTNVDVVQALFMNDRADFLFDTKTHLLVKAIYYSKGKPANSVRLSNYVDVDGIKMPSKMVLEASDGEFEYNLRFQLNVEYNEDIFTKPPLFEAGAEAWKKKK